MKRTRILVLMGFTAKALIFVLGKDEQSPVIA